MNSLFLVTLLTTIMTLFGVYWYVQTNKKEGFENVEENPLVTVMGTIRRLSTTLMDVNLWKERITMSSMSPVDLARFHLNSIAKSEDA